MEKENKKIENVDGLIALCHILDEYDEFSKNLSNLMVEEYNRDNVNYLYQISNGKFIVGAEKVK